MNIDWPVLVVGIINLGLGWVSGIVWEKSRQSQRDGDK